MCVRGWLCVGLSVCLLDCLFVCLLGWLGACMCLVACVRVSVHACLMAVCVLSMRVFA